MPKTSYGEQAWERARWLGAELGRVRRARGLELRELEALSGVRYDALRTMLAGRSAGPSFFAVGAVAEACGLSLDDLYRRSTGGARARTPEAFNLIARVATRFARNVDAALNHARPGLSLPQYRILVLLADGPSCPRDLAEIVHVSSATISSVLDGLAARGYLRRERDPADGRKIIVRLTPQGTRVLANANQAVEARIEDISRFLPPDQVERSVDVLTHWEDAINRRRRAYSAAAKGRDPES